jgi:multiple sugar transport system ATP-binding protein
MRAEIKELHQRHKTTTVYVTHDQIEAMTMADKIVVMHDGRIEQIGAPLDLYDDPANLFVAGFIGSPAMNFIEGTLDTKGGAPVVVAADGTRLPLMSAPASANGTKVVYGTRPEHIMLADDGLPAEVVVVEPTGAEVQVLARLAGVEISAVFRERHPLRPGETIHLKPRADLALVFDKQTGNRIRA